MIMTLIGGALIFGSAITAQFTKSTTALNWLIAIAGIGVGAFITSRYYEYGWEDALGSIIAMSVVLILLRLYNGPSRAKADE